MSFRAWTRYWITSGRGIRASAAAGIKYYSTEKIPDAALVPEMTYEDMAVANGQDAGMAWDADTRRDWIRSNATISKKALLEYCGQDTLALVKLVKSTA